MSDPALAAQAKSPIGKIEVEAGVTQAQRDAFASAIQNLDTYKIDAPGADLLAKLHLNDTAPATLHEWLEERVQYLASQNLDLDSHAYLVQAHYAYPEPDQFPVSEKPTRTLPSDGSIQVLMANIGGAIYTSGKAHSQLIGLRLDGIGDVIVRSPRSGILMIGDGLFPVAGSKSVLATDTAALAIFRLGTLFHEARHSDGNGVSAGFLHAVCPDGSDYSGLTACDRNSNGPYTVGAMFTRDLTSACTDCTVAGKEWLKLAYLDSFSRMIGSEADSPAWDDAPEGEL